MTSSEPLPSVEPPSLPGSGATAWLKRRPGEPEQASATPSLSLVMPTIGWDDTFSVCAKAALAALQPGDEALIVFDGTPPLPPSWLMACGARLLCTGRRQGPAAARNLAAQHATCDVLVFVDADVALHSDALDRIRTHVAADPQLAAVFGSYDDQPAAPGLVSRFRNLLHHHTHNSHPGPATTFWAGCGAVRRRAFLALGGFDAAAYPLPSIEDIAFGLRLSDSGGRILLDPSIQGTHHKRWTLRSMLLTDIRQRAIPWSRLLLRRGQPSTSLNLDLSSRLSSLLSLTLLLGVALCSIAAALWPVPLLALLLVLLLNRRFYALCHQRGGLPLAATAVGLHVLYFLYSLLCYAAVMFSQPLVARRAQPPAAIRP